MDLCTVDNKFLELRIFKFTALTLHNITLFIKKSPINITLKLQFSMQYNKTVAQIFVKFRLE